MKNVILFLLGLLLSAGTSLWAQDLSVYQKKTFTGPDGRVLPYRILYPEGYQQGQQYPLVVFLHGAGERGDNNEAQLTHGARLFADSAMRRQYPAVVVFPQCANDDYWARIEAPEVDGKRQFSFPFFEAPAPSLSLVSALIDQLMASNELRIDPFRVYLGGLSMGAMGTFELLARRPHTFAAAFAICGGGHPLLTSLYAPHTPLWIFHGDADPVVPVQLSQRMVQSIENQGIWVRYNEYPGVGHDSWTQAFAEPQLLPWLFTHRKK